jgi:hypothetical protein
MFIKFCIYENISYYFKVNKSQNKTQNDMKNFTTRMLDRKVEVSFNHPKLVTAIFQAQSTSFACQGNWKTQMVSIPKDEYSIEKLEAEVNKGFNVYYY